MSLIFATQLTGVATAVLAAFAIVTAWYARRAFLKQSREVTAIERQVADGQELARQQAELLKIQSGQMELQRGQLEEQRKASAAQSEVLRLQAADLRESLAERTRQAEQARRAQAVRVFLTEESFNGRTKRGMDGYGEVIGVGAKPPSATATAHNTSDQPIYDLKLLWHRGTADHGDPNPEPLGTLLPGEVRKSKRDFPEATNMGFAGAVLHFRDAAGAKWRRWSNGDLVEQP
jgi:hypothetical protein